MCIGIPMQVRTSGSGWAVCEGMGVQREVDTLLVGDHQPGTWMLVFLNSAREILSEQEAETISNAVQAINLVMQSPDNASATPLQAQQLDSLFADLIDREPPKPDSLIDLEQQTHQANASTLNKSGG